MLNCQETNERSFWEILHKIKEKLHETVIPEMRSVALLWWWVQSPFSSQSAPEWTSTSAKRSNWVTMTLKTCQTHQKNTSSGCLILGFLIKGEKKTAAHHKVSAATEHFSRDTTVRAAGVFRIQNITRGKRNEHKETSLSCQVAEFNVKKKSQRNTSVLTAQCRAL